MTVIAQNVSVTYTSAGSAGPYAFNFPISTAGALSVTVNNVVQPPTAYTVTAVNNNFDNGGSVTLNAAPPSGQVVVLKRTTPLTQASVFADNLPQPMQQFEDALDKLTEIVQELAANQAGGGGATSIVAGTGIVVTGAGTVSNPYVIALVVSLSITSFTGGQAGELGQSFTNPTFTAAYSGTPTSANVTNTDSIDSPHILTTPFTTATIVGTFKKTATGTTTFTLTASNGVNTPTATQTITWAERIFAGMGAAGATSSVTASGTTAVLSTSDALPSAGLGVETIGQTFGPFSPSGKNIYLLLNGGTHTFTDALTGFPFSFNSPLTVTFVNQYGVSVTMYLYQSTNVLTGTFSPRIVS